MLFDGAAENFYMQFINSEYLFYWSKNGATKSVGIYSLTDGKICSPIYENATLEGDGIYGIKLGKKTLLLKYAKEEDQ